MNIKDELGKEFIMNIVKTLDKYAQAKPQFLSEKLKYAIEIAGHFDNFKQNKALVELIDLLPDDKKKELGIRQ